MHSLCLQKATTVYSSIICFCLHVSYVSISNQKNVLMYPCNVISHDIYKLTYFMTESNINLFSYTYRQINLSHLTLFIDQWINIFIKA